ncbi:MAG: ATP synthase F1 subunit gamma [Bacteroidetes bacterium]|nr:ATP synthase F1 subunit gamma [Bacteroidota bacterium]
MAGLKEVRVRIASVKTTLQITSAMKMMAAAKLRKAQTAIVKLRPYALKLNDILRNLSSSIEDSNENLYVKQRQPEKILLVVIASNRGLCGSFNSNVIRTTTSLIAHDYTAQSRKNNVSLITIGRKASDHFRKRNYNVVENRDDLFDNLTYENVALLAEKIMMSFLNKEYDRVYIIYNQFKNAAVQTLTVEQYLPIMPVNSKQESINNDALSNYIFEPDKETIIRELIPKSLRIKLFKALLDSFASEQGARMTAMQNASVNAQDMIRDLQLSYNKARQAAITKELLEIVSGAEALKG